MKDKLENLLDCTIWTQLGYHLNNKVGDQLRTQLWAQLGSPSLCEISGGRLFYMLEEELKNEI